VTVTVTIRDRDRDRGGDDVLIGLTLALAHTTLPAWVLPDGEIVMKNESESETPARCHLFAITVARPLRSSLSQIGSDVK
jgi:hypothetical protein